MSAIAAKRQLSRLRGKIVRLSPRQPFYLIVSPEHRSMERHRRLGGFKTLQPGWADRITWRCNPPPARMAPNPQALQVTQVMTNRPCRTIKVGRVQVRFFVKRGIERTPTQQAAGAVAPLLVSTAEATAYDLVRYATSIGGIERAAETIRPLLPLLRARELRRVLDAENEPAVAQRLGFVIEACGNKSLAKAVRDWLPDELTPVTLSPAKGKRDNLPLVKRWQVFNNSSELKI